MTVRARARARVHAVAVALAIGSVAWWAGRADAEDSAARSEARPAAHPPSSCVACHAESEDELLAPVTAWEGDVHRAAGLGCESCHGGDPVAEEDDEAMAAAKGFRPPPGRLEVPAFCARCHADAEYMKRFDPQARVDQFAEYRTSGHGMKNAAGDSVPAVCTDCHGAHGVRDVTSPNSPVFATNVPQTCGRCHADSSLMAPYGIATDQLDLYARSVHAEALLGRGDVAAPACNDCHGNHGATPPGVASVANVCGQCHAREAALFRASFKKQTFDDLGLPECTVCHDHHDILHPTPELFHAGAAAHVSRGSIPQMEPLVAAIGDLEAGDSASVEWRVALSPFAKPDDPGLRHVVEVACDGAPSLEVDATQRPGAAETPAPADRGTSNELLSASLRVEPLSGWPAEAGDALRLDLTVKALGAARGVVLRDRPGARLHSISESACLPCHAEGDSCAQATQLMYGALISMEREIREAGALLRRAEIAGMEVSDPRFELKSKGTTASVEARALIHAFDPGRLIARTEEGRAVAASASAAARAALAEVQNRRKGLAVSLILVAIVLAGLGAKIAEIERSRRNGGGRSHESEKR